MTDILTIAQRAVENSKEWTAYRDKLDALGDEGGAVEMPRCSHASPVEGALGSAVLALTEERDALRALLREARPCLRDAGDLWARIDAALKETP